MDQRNMRSQDLITLWSFLSMIKRGLSSLSGRELGPSQRAESGSGWTSTNTPSAPAATAALDRWLTNSLWPPEHVPPPPGSCTLCVASNTTGNPNSFIRAMDLMSTIRLLYPKEVPRSVSKRSRLPVEVAFSMVGPISHGEREIGLFLY